MPPPWKTEDAMYNDITTSKLGLRNLQKEFEDGGRVIALSNQVQHLQRMLMSRPQSPLDGQPVVPSYPPDFWLVPAFKKLQDNFQTLAKHTAILEAQVRELQAHLGVSASSASSATSPPAIPTVILASSSSAADGPTADHDTEEDDDIDEWGNEIDDEASSDADEPRPKRLRR